MEDVLSAIKAIYERIFSQLNQNKPPAQTKIEFYPYIGVNSRIRLRDGILHVKISDILRDAPLDFHHALAEILLKKLFGRKVPASVLQAYRVYVNQPEMRDKSIETRKLRGRKVLKGSQGNVYDLSEIFDLLNQIYFQGTLPKPTLTWSATRTYRILGHHDSTHETVAVSRSLDDKSVPRYVVEYVVYHEMLHIKHPTKYVGGRRYNHTPNFKRDEQEFAYFDEAENWIERNARKLKKEAKRK